MPSDRARDLWPGTTHNGFSGPPEPEVGRPPPRATRRVSRTLLLGGVAAAVGLGLLAGAITRPNLGQGEKAPPMRAVTQPSTETLDVEVNKPVVLPAPKSTGRLEVLAPDLARDAPRMVAAAAPTPLPRIDAPPAPPGVETPAADEASFSCRAAGSPAEQMVCEDPGLARADRRLRQAYERALHTGVIPPRELREDQRDWLAIREDAAHRSPEAVRSIYEQRIDELNAIAEDPG